MGRLGGDSLSAALLGHIQRVGVPFLLAMTKRRPVEGSPGICRTC